uniref:flavin-containing monooxygenase 5-like isoform X2 n=1 Tax=Doryrhamphus excisus TaxID=161450 RepID=UPI0025AEBC8A|nr:flavin-containing monooxygenase 5-like isoform X2 [Doryrhamphus excisus]
MVQRVAIIGAGISGLTSIKACLEEGLVPTCFESSHDIGGLWRFKEEPEPGRANIYQSVVINSSKEMMAFSDFPPPAHFPNNMHHSEVMLYLRLYAQTFRLLQHIRLQTAVVSVRQTPDFATTGQWEVETEKRDGPRQTHIFDAVMVCTGHYTTPHLPLKDFPESFEGKYFHSWEYRSFEGLQGKRVVVIGIGNSGGDIAVDVSKVAEKVFFSTRSGAWVMTRLGLGGLPRDLLMNSRIDAMKRRLFPRWINWMTERKLNQTFDHTLYGLKPKHSFLSQRVVVNDDLPIRIITGHVQMKPNVKRFSGSAVLFDDGSIVDKVDVVVFATGYSCSFSFLPATLQSKCGRHRLYRRVIPLGHAPHTLAVVGLIDGRAAITGLSEMQARWSTRVFKGLISLPSEETMTEELEKEMDVRQNFTYENKNPLHVDVIPYRDSLAKQVGALPNLWWLLLTDPRLAFHIFLGPCTSYQYRLTGPGKWDGARQAILTQWERVFQPFQTRKAAPERKSRCSPQGLGIIMVVFSGAALLTCCFYKLGNVSSCCS